ncbi:MAG: MaoC family dehydratase [Geminicoccaceae bacterium]|nr:MAG: MaoC family dehydratase [Geminicoccaceae bacterium]
MSKTYAGRFFEDFRVGETLIHATPRTVTSGDATLYLALTGSRYAQFCCDDFARRNGLPAAPLDDLLTFHMVFGKSVPDVSWNAVANLGYAEGRFYGSVFVGETIYARSEVIGLRANSNGQTGTVWVRTRGYAGTRLVVDFVRWVMIRRRDVGGPAPETVVPKLSKALSVDELFVNPGMGGKADLDHLSGSRFSFEDYEVGERIDHVEGFTVDEAEHRMATRLYQNTAKVHFDAFAERHGRFGKCIVYGGHVISLARSLSFNGLAGCMHVVGINGGRHVGPTFAGDTIYAWSEVLDKQPLPRHRDVGALRLRLVATKDRPCHEFPDKDEEGRYPAEVVLDFDYWAIMPRAK